MADKKPTPVLFDTVPERIRLSEALRLVYEDGKSFEDYATEVMDTLCGSMSMDFWYLGSPDDPRNQLLTGQRSDLERESDWREQRRIFGQ